MRDSKGATGHNDNRLSMWHQLCSEVMFALLGAAGGLVWWPSCHDEGGPFLNPSGHCNDSFRQSEGAPLKIILLTFAYLFAGCFAIRFYPLCCTVGIAVTREDKGY